MSRGDLPLPCFNEVSVMVRTAWAFGSGSFYVIPSNRDTSVRVSPAPGGLRPLKHPMDPTLLARRQAAADPHNAALSRWPGRNSDAFAQELRTVVSDLHWLAQEADRTGGDPVERARTWRYLGDAYFHLAQGRDSDLLSRAAVAYIRAEQLNEGGDELESAKLTFKFANTLWGLSQGIDVPLLEEARRRYLDALEVFRVEAPAHVPTVEQTLAILDHQLALA